MSYYADTTAVRCLSLLERYAPKLMAAGGGALEGRCACADFEIAGMMRDAASGMNREAIAAKWGRHPVTVGKHLRARGIYFARPRKLNRATT